MSKVKIEVEGYKCMRCGYEWIPRKEGEPKVCPHCHSAWWNTPKKESRKGDKKRNLLIPSKRL